MLRKVLYKGVVLLLFPGFLYSQWWSSNLNDATAFNNGRHIQIIPDDYSFNHIVYHTYESSLYEGHYIVYDCIGQFTYHNMVINSSEKCSLSFHSYGSL